MIYTVVQVADKPREGWVPYWFVKFIWIYYLFKLWL